MISYTIFHLFLYLLKIEIHQNLGTYQYMDLKEKKIEKKSHFTVRKPNKERNCGIFFDLYINDCH